ncbi:hypothetical protein PM082_022801 [Marasmius tenuissimus]|nr:hypothetical protein PM082_022801 [Marasmius tenuissimus]
MRDGIEPKTVAKTERKWNKCNGCSKRGEGKTAAMSTRNVNPDAYFGFAIGWVIFSADKCLPLGMFDVASRTRWLNQESVSGEKTGQKNQPACPTVKVEDAKRLGTPYAREKSDQIN